MSVFRLTIFPLYLLFPQEKPCPNWAETADPVALIHGQVNPTGQRGRREKGAFRGKTNKLNTKIKIVTFMVKKEDEFFFLIIRVQKDQEGKRQDGEGRAGSMTANPRADPKTIQGKASVGETGEVECSQSSWLAWERRGCVRGN